MNVIVYLAAVAVAGPSSARRDDVRRMLVGR
jgi:hypothetical protein